MRRRHCVKQLPAPQAGEQATEPRVWLSIWCADRNAKLAAGAAIARLSTPPRRSGSRRRMRRSPFSLAVSSRGNLAEAPAVEVVDGLPDLRIAVHDEWSVARDRLIDGFPGQHQ
jgi:hypothetical protein